MKEKIMEIYAGVIFFNDTPELLERCMIALKANGFKIIAVDGAFQEFPLAENEKYYSTDGCLDIARHYADIHIDAPKDGWFNQAEKRNEYFKRTPIGEYVMSIDADEQMIPFKFDTPLQDDVYGINQIRFQEDGTTLGPFRTIRCYKMYDDLRYLFRHCTVYRMKDHRDGDLKSGLVTCAKGAMNSTRKRITDKNGNILTIHNRQDLRSKQRQAQKKQYKENRKEWEYRRALNDF